MSVTREARALCAARIAMRFDRRLRKFTDDHLSEDYAWAYGAARWRPLVVRLSGSRAMRAAAFVAGVEISELVALLLNEYGYGLAGLAGCRMLVSEVMGAPVSVVSKYRMASYVILGMLVAMLAVVALDSCTDRRVDVAPVASV